METPSNPLLRITDIAAAAELAHSSAGKRTVVAVDNTFCSPILQQPLSLDADLVIASDTKFLNGHSYVIGGSVVAANQQDVDLIAFHANMMGLTASPAGFLADLARFANPWCEDAGSLRERRSDGGDSPKSPGRHSRLLAWPAQPPRP